jgi:hypothetical protein
LWRGEAFDSVGVSLIGALIIPKPVLPPVRENDEGGAHILGVAAGLVLGVVRVKILSLRLEDAKRATRAAQNVVGPATVSV